MAAFTSFVPLKEHGGADAPFPDSQLVPEQYEYLSDDEDEDYVVSLERPISVRTFGNDNRSDE
jgi:hypothetical protein